MIAYQFVPASTFEEALANLYDIVSMLRSPEGCPWDREQKPYDVARALLDETYEYIDALRSGESDAVCEEIGDMLLNTFMIIHMHEQNKNFTPVEPINAVCEKLIRRHPHVFSDVHAHDSTQVLGLWNSIKESVEGKKADKDDIFSRIPTSLPQLEEAWEIQKCMKKVGFDWPDITGVIEKVHEEIGELEEAIGDAVFDQGHVEEELGDVLFAVVNLARYLKISPSVALHRSNRKVRNRFNKLASIAQTKNVELSHEHVDELNEIWESIKVDER